MTANTDCVAIDRALVHSLNDHAAIAANLVGHVDAIVHELTELLGGPQAIVAPDAVAPDDRVAHDRALMLASGVGGVR
jgi:hypothetical protein